ncbi:hypothetical protein Aasi_0294 [Candidatus Amoebophilus asiaticus 5a2]|uniref:UPF0235 protein Aasi_0294 n=1 Tax=Amoebophilus asiaticus (strain 5a2) TaxID=452471 RepID=Y294_AMOA5|nr:DUF167 domain-containing protein [Candidatus Amoebophilus asiaticus]B3ER80.1 RecName: Full=UPF0235 protein Aasi_0294 [Candidatus Amoebophilus asiaticus 5a2]ACE05732.1 hypothetical protein Aasi_0294 [Candidatus Amoebophilus asiaticus 5a2]
MSIVIEVKAIPKSKISAITIDKLGRLCIRITSAPENGKANREIIKLIAKTLKLPQANVEIIAGLTIKLKRIRITSSFLNEGELMNALLPSMQQKLFE